VYSFLPVNHPCGMMARQAGSDGIGIMRQAVPAKAPAILACANSGIGGQRDISNNKLI
jgi:hypothetical protein